ncbi:Bifunctional NAD(P)H-hydrate repair enzyme Nnr [Pseudidiomarina piscicola]|uniref:Bifunctional NAD(P)H-hydrate repair enzyme n=1 Tax=Pseudidiomarina piscicola TaxID=2614830 RepID=A0A6S6WU45_9GAMM|nr:NAD(P)H-hydrate dehydratase [Pseudidiomarina piscicola]CAB0150612.1 Bifunctional NAD(P)H-hydrate repair enzyme Nnr [Pseudidiomarina piscicola]VZT40114.1 Bifunctional NAD(P)H-hydrate repair enzyme Nnr [Pseudomonas aeruginosa]
MQVSMQQLIYLTAQVRDRELEAAESLCVSAAQLMHRAAQSCLAALERVHPAPGRVMILCGPGNNGGDGWVLARLAREHGYQVQVVAAEPKTELAKQAALAWEAEQGSVEPLAQLDRTHVAEYDIIVDAMLGTGLSRDLDEMYCRAVNILNDAKHYHKLWVLSIDCPTGLQSDRGVAIPVAVEADYTVTLVALKPGLLTAEAARYVGHLELAELGISASFRHLEQPFATIIERDEVARHLPPRSRSSHKGSHGHVVIIGGAPGMSGAVVLAGRAALRAGAGKVSVLTHPDSHAIVASAQPELMVSTSKAESQAELTEFISRASVVVLGPGLGQKSWGRKLSEWVLAADVPVVLDADGLNALAQQPSWAQRQAPLWLTPHPGEAARLLATDTHQLEQDRWLAVQQIAARYQAYILLKGAGSLCVDKAASSIRVCSRGTPALAVGGAGDVLSGIAGSLVAQGVVADEVLPCAAWLHAVAGEHAAIAGERGTLPSDLMEPLRKLVNP